MSHELQHMRDRFGALLVWLLWAHVPVLALAAYWNHAMSVPAAILAGSVLAGFSVAGFWVAVLGAIVYSLIGLVIDAVVERVL